jgi:endonuclease/exonuclease/phosphatase family metal-dependent hydrolase
MENKIKTNQIKTHHKHLICNCVILFAMSIFGIITIAGCGGGGMNPESPNAPKIITARALTANVGNADILNCYGYLYKLCLSSMETTIAKNIAALNPDIIALQEIAPSSLCESIGTDTNSRRVCYQYQQKSIREQVRRLLGANFTVVCDGRNNFECIGVRTDFGNVSGCNTGELCMTSGAFTHEVPSGCDSKAALFGINVSISGESFRIINAHPQAIGEDCRAEGIQRMFEGYGDTLPLAPVNTRSLVMGDMNLDPYRDDSDDPDVAMWNRHVGVGKGFQYHSGIAERNPPYKTSITGKTIDHVVSNFARGSCVTLGEAPGTTRLDGITIETDYYQPEANDHLAIMCNLILYN